MAGVVRQKIDQAALENFLAQNVSEIATPIELQQVSGIRTGSSRVSQLTNTCMAVQTWPVKPNLSDNGGGWPKIHPTQAPSGEANLEACAPSRPRVPGPPCFGEH